MTALEQAIITEARSWAGTPFRHMAAVKGVGVDCIHFVHAVLQAVGLTHAEVPHYSPDWHLHKGGGDRLLAGLLEHCEEVQPPYQVGDILTYRYGRAASHCGLYVGEGKLIHAATRDQVRCDEIENPALARRFAGAFRVKPCSR